MSDECINVVLVDDEIEILKALTRIIRKFECHLHTFSEPKKALDFIKNNEVTIICSDQRMPEISGYEVLTQVKESWPNSHRIMLSAYQDFDNIAQGFNDGTIQRFIAKPWNNKEIESIFSQVLKSTKAGNVNSFSGIIGASQPMQKLFSLISSAAGANVPIFIHGETGTGKELIAKACHQSSYRVASPFIPVNCANLSEHLIESQLFGHKKGAFTGAVKDQLGYFELAGNGTLFLDEICTLPLPLQAKLLRVIQEREFSPLGSHQVKKFDAQVVSASSTSLATGVEQGEFREDLYYRLAVIQLNVPRLADRGDDVTQIAQFYIEKYAKEHDKKFKGLSDDAKAYITHYDWPGNVRQLENLLHGVVILNQGELITQDMLMQNMDQITRFTTKQTSETMTSSEIIPLAAVEKQTILSAIAQCDGNIALASKLLEINPSTVYRKMSKW